MATTVEQLIRAAIATSRHNVRGETASDAELIALIGDLLAGYATEGARVNRRFFGERWEVEFDDEAGGWPRPAEATMIVPPLRAGEGMQTADGDPIPVGTEIVDLAADQLDAEPGRPAVYSWGQVWRSAGRHGDPATGTLVVLGSRLPSRPVGVDDEIDPLWPEAHVPLLRWDLAIYLAQKDGEREDEVAAFTAQRDRAYARFLTFLEAESITEVRDYGFGGAFPAPGVTPR